MRKQPFKTIFLLLYAIFGSAYTPLNAQESPVIFQQALDTILNIGASTKVFVDRTATLDIKSIISKNNAQKFIPLDDLVLEGKYTSSKYNYWLHFSVINNSDDTIPPLVFKCGMHEQIDFYQISGDLMIQKEAGFGRYIDYTDRLFANKYSIRLKIPPHRKQDIYVRIFNELNFSKPFAHLKGELYEFKTDSSTLLIYYIFHAFLFTFLVFTTLFILTQYIINKEKAFLYYALLVFSTFILYYKLFDIANPILQLLPPSWSTYPYFTFFSFLPPIPGILFVMTFFKTAKNYPKIHYFIQTALVFLFLYFVLDKLLWWYDKDLAWRTSDFFRIAFFLALIFPIATFLKAKNKLANLILTGILISVICTSINMILRMTQSVENYGYWDIPYIIQYVGLILSYIFLWLGLGYLSKQTQEEKNAIQQNLETEKQEKVFEQKTNQLRNTFFTNITHEFRTPLTIINGLSAELEQNTNNDKGIQQKANFIHKNGKKMLLLVNQLLNLSKLDAGKTAVHYQQSDIIPFLKYLIHSFQSFAGSKNIKLIFNANIKQLLMDYDADKLQTILSNVLSNAIKFSSNDRVITITIQQSKEPVEQLTVSIKDKGIGIDPASLPFIFDRFHQEQGQHKNTGKGSGIGLALVKELMDLLEAKILVESNLNQGSTFHLLFPITKNAPLVEEQIIEIEKPILEISPSPISNNKKGPREHSTILVVEDNPDVRFFITSCLQEHYQILEATDGQEGINMATSIIPDLIISDVMMPNKDGFELCSELKSHEKTDHIPIILLTAKATQSDKNLGLHQGADAYLIKPFDKNELLIRITNLLASRKKLQARFQQIASGVSPTSEPNTATNPLLAQIDGLLEVHYTDEAFSTPQLCKTLGYSKSRMYESIKKEAGLSPGLYIRAFRLRKAKALLIRDQNISMREVAYDVGFKSPVYFAQEFKKAFGCSPGKFQKK